MLLPDPEGLDARSPPHALGREPVHEPGGQVGLGLKGTQPEVIRAI